MPCWIHAPVENTENLDADAALTKDDHMTLVGIAENAGLEFQAFVPERLIAAQPLQTCCDSDSVTTGLLFAPLFPRVPADLGQIAKRWPRQPELHYPGDAG